MTREYPPEIYGGAGVHVGFLVPRLRELIDVDVHCFGAPREDAVAHQPAPGLTSANTALRALSVDLSMTDAASSVDLVHSHTWYANLAGHLAGLLHGVPHVVTAHSLEPRRPWKAEQLGGGYRLSSWVERTAYEAAAAVIAVSDGMRADVLSCYPALDPERVHVVRNGIDTDAYRPVAETDALRALGVDPERPIVAFVGRITRQKGVAHLVAAAHHLDPDAQLVLCAGAPDTPEIGEEVGRAVAELAAVRPGVFWVQRMLEQAEIRQVLTHAAVFVCPSVYEPLGIVNLEAMACGTAVVASDVGGIPEVVAHGETGLLVPLDEQDPTAFQRGLADEVNALLADPARAEAMGAAGRRRAVTEFSWAGVAEQTVSVYRAALTG
ncbi:starch synthase [Actinoalloteichus hoggarensis]|uniref:Capsular glucan synthase n=2 Tax=Actinoalloteichus hoggarensis TaxID=1470176 RepID=A0A221VYB4_9PSEU|nr:Capsular glucan synthase [Actinoalloteichus hoggarensis]MBB5921908.1 starch synthase [Actinoalloteichus hoggarensis]